jgi:hypothetical protein
MTDPKRPPLRLTRQDRNELFKAISASKLDPAEFNLIVAESAARIIHTSGSDFLFGNDTSGRKYIGRARVVDGTQTSFEEGSSVSNLTRRIWQWANEIEEVSDIPDLWAEMQRNRELISEIEQANSDNSPFTEDEQRQISAQLQEIKNQIREQFELPSEQIEQINARLDRAEEASKRIGRKDWLLLFGGAILNLIVTDTVTPSIAGHIYTMVIQGIAHLFGGGPPQILS